MDNGSCLRNNDVQNIQGSAHSNHTLSFRAERLIGIQAGTSSGMPRRKWGHRNRSWGVNEANHADPTLSPLRLTCYSFQLELHFYSERWLHWYTSWLSFERLRHHGRTLPEDPCSNKAPTHMSVLRRSEVRWARSHHPFQLPDNKPSEERWLGEKKNMRFICSLFFLLLSIQRRASGRWFRKRKIRTQEPRSYVLHHMNGLHLSLSILQHTPKWGNLEEG